MTTMNGPIVERDNGARPPIRTQDRFELEPQIGVGGATELLISGNLYWEHQTPDLRDQRGLIWARGTGIKLSPESIPTLISLLAGYAVDEAAHEHRTGRKLPDGSWEPIPQSDWNAANPQEVTR
jgi:hypothetical protein